MKMYIILTLCITFATILVLLCIWKFLPSLHSQNHSLLDADAVASATRLMNYPAEITDRSTYDALTFDPQKAEYGIISYQLSKPAWIRIRIVRKEQKDLVLRTLVDWAYREEGKNIEKWDAKDQSGSLVDNRQCFVTFDVDSKEHRKHDRGKCRELQVEIISPAGGNVNGICKISARLIKDGSGYGEIHGYEARYYIDYRLQNEVSYPEGFSGDFDFFWDTGSCENGEYIIVVVVNDHCDHIGSTSMKVFIKSGD